MTTRSRGLNPANVGVTITSIAAVVAAGLMFAIGLAVGAIAGHLLGLHAPLRGAVEYGDGAAFALVSLVSSARRHVPRLRRVTADH